MVLFSIVLNSFVHVIMYSYYFAALFGPAVQQKLERVKKSITIIQMVCVSACYLFKNVLISNNLLLLLIMYPSFQIQFTIILTQCVLGIARDCDIPRVLVAIYAPNVGIIFYMFYDFFKKAYYRKSQASSKKLN